MRLHVTGLLIILIATSTTAHHKSFWCKTLGGWFGDSNCTKALYKPHYDCDINDGCVCQNGYTRQDNVTCSDTNECLSNHQHVCGRLEKCRNVFGGYRCDCKQGYRKQHPGEKAQCVDINECFERTHQCSDYCHNIKGGYYCTCPSTKEFGRTLENKKSEFECVDINECARGTDTCDKFNGFCTNKFDLTGFECSCNPGFRKENIGGRTKCFDINECNLENNKNVCSHRCVNTPGSWHCDCNLGYELLGDSRSCGDVDECRKSSVCGHLCDNTVGSFTCSCRRGYTLAKNLVDCKDEDECTTKKNPCHSKANCKNEVGSYTCRCKHGYRGDGRHKCNKIKCSYLVNPLNGNVSAECLNTAPAEPSFNSSCDYSCNRGYSLTGLSGDKTSRRCTVDGWTDTTPICKPLKCRALKIEATVDVVYPASCKKSQGVSFGQLCRFTCKRGFKIEKGMHSTVKCIINSTTDVLQWTNSEPICVKAFIPPTISCPNAVKVVQLARGKSTYSLEIPKPKSNVKTITVHPLKYKIGQMSVFKSGLTKITFTAVSGNKKDSCTYNVRVQDVEPPTVEGCPSDMEKIVESATKIGNITWDEPVFKDNVNVSKQIQHIFPDDKFTIGNYVVQYTVFDEAGNKATCQFKITIKTKPCGTPLYNKKTTGVSCDGWEKGIFCTVTCKARRKFIVKPESTTLVCNAGKWTPSNVAPACVQYNRISRRNRRRPCPPGKLKDMRRKVCLNCPEGTYLDGKQCTVCPIGEYSDTEASTSCTKCPEGKTTRKSGTTSITDCIGACPAGSFSVNGEEPCQDCPVGKYQPNTAQQECIVCPANSITSSMGSNSSSDCFAPARAAIVPSQRRITKNTGDNISLSCIGKGLPKPSVTWSRKYTSTRLDWTTSVKSQGENFKEVVLNIRNLTDHDADDYVCTVDTGRGKPAVKAISVSVRMSKA